MLSAWAPSYAAFLVYRALYGIGMGGYWGVGASYAIESAPPRFRGILSGVMQAGYPVGYLLAAVVMQTLTPSLGWRIAFFVGLPVAILIVILTSLAQESGAWKKHHGRSGTSVFRSMLANRSIFAYLLLPVIIMIKAQALFIILMIVIIGRSHKHIDTHPDNKEHEQDHAAYNSFSPIHILLVVNWPYK